MKPVNWPQLWQQSKMDPYKHAAFSLLLFNGLNVIQIERLPEAKVDLNAAWLTTYDGSTFPLVTHTVNALKPLYTEGAALSSERLIEAAHSMDIYESDAHRRLAGAIWITDKELKLMLEVAGTPEGPVMPLRFTFPFSVAERLQHGESSDVANQGRLVLQTASDWLVEQTLSANVPIAQRILGLLRQGSLLFLIASTGVSALNLIHNVVMGRLLSPADYGQLTFIITFQLLVGLLPSAFQTVVARFSARYQARGDSALMFALRQLSERVGWLGGLCLGGIFLILSPIMVSVFQLDNIWLLLVIIVTIPFFVRAGVDRGLLQGLGAYFWLSSAYVSEAIIRLVVSALLGYALLSVGHNLSGAVLGLAESMVVAWFIARLGMRYYKEQPINVPVNMLTTERKEWTQLAIATGLVLVGQALITNSDFLLVKNFFSPADAGYYAAVSVLGRIVYFGALPLTILLVPLIARRQALNEPTRPILLLLLGGGAAVCGLLVLLAAVFGAAVLGLLYGSEYVQAAGLLAPYALAASLYTLTNLVITYQIALGKGGETLLPILAGVAQIGGILLFHESLNQVIMVQIVLMAILFGGVLCRVVGLNQPVKETGFSMQAAS